MCENKDTCGKCAEFMGSIQQCSHPMVYMNHSDNTYKTLSSAEACGFFFPITGKEAARKQQINFV